MSQADDAVAFANAMRLLTDDATFREQMGKTAREHMERREFQFAFEQLWDMYVCETPARDSSPDFDTAVVQAFAQIVSKAS